MIKKTFKLWWGWAPNKIEQYLEDMALNGWKLIDVSYGFTFFTFEKNEPQKIRFVFDYRLEMDSEYKMIIEDDHWHLFKSKNGWILWYKGYEEQRPELITDSQSLIDRNKRLLRTLALSWLLQLPLLTIIFLSREAYDMVFHSLLFIIIYLTLMALLFIATLRLIIATRHLSKNNPN